ncbi:TIGR03915 family putative DNA repair protein [Mesonia maritima]|uniref:DNA metabolism protein n=1 Tax=Mesonia maritima TaxID=1793873 RepID=A0ABU1K4Z1_9FLAO|nr:TIGR03915 family putative DNA repair protein [Mesonia maritima]MDR6300682.1 putative DNA metabolism protein [Mesonia maritima]
MIFKYDGSFEGFLTAVFSAYEFKCENCTIVKENEHVESLFEETEEVITSEEKANRVWKKIQQKTGTKGSRQIYWAFLSELLGVENTLFQYIQHAINSAKNITTDYANKAVLEVSQIVKKVGREKHRMDAFVRFRKTKDNIYFATIEPDFNVLPLNAKHFKNRYADQYWCIYDLKRNYGIYYDLNSVEIIQLELPNSILNTSTDFFTPEEMQFQQLWKNYFDSTNIKSRKNTKLHHQHVPKRYWKYLSEKYL